MATRYPDITPSSQLTNVRGTDESFCVTSSSIPQDVVHVVQEIRLVLLNDGTGPETFPPCAGRTGAQNAAVERNAQRMCLDVETPQGQSRMTGPEVLCCPATS